MEKLGLMLPVIEDIKSTLYEQSQDWSLKSTLCLFPPIALFINDYVFKEQ
jgi:hypothetical protein